MRAANWERRFQNKIATLKYIQMLDKTFKILFLPKYINMELRTKTKLY